MNVQELRFQIEENDRLANKDREEGERLLHRAASLRGMNAMLEQAALLMSRICANAELYEWEEFPSELTGVRVRDARFIVLGDGQMALNRGGNLYCKSTFAVGAAWVLCSHRYFKLDTDHEATRLGHLIVLLREVYDRAP